MIELAIHNVTPGYVRSLRSLGLSGTSSVSGVVKMKIHRVTPEYVRELEGLGYGGLARGQLLKMSIHRVTPTFIREMREAGFRDLSPETLVRMMIDGVDSKFVRSAITICSGRLGMAPLHASEVTRSRRRIHPPSAPTPARCSGGRTSAFRGVML